MADHQTPGDKLSARLASRSGLHRQTMEDGGAVYKGPLASKALSAVGARAMTLDETIIVGDDFDPSDPQDQALYAHERVHQLESGGDDHPNDMRDAEEVGARAVERMVVHRRASGESFGDIMRDVKDPVNRSARTTQMAAAAPAGPRGAAAGPAEAISAMMAQGKSYEQVVDVLARKVIDALVEREQSSIVRSTPIKTM